MIPFAKHMFQMGHQNHQDLRDAIDEQKRLRAQSEASELIPKPPWNWGAIFAPENRPSQKERIVFQPSIFRGY